MKVAMIAAMSENRVIGSENSLPWHLPEDLKHFRRITQGHPVIMGRKTYESIGRPLPKRQNIVISRRPDLQLEGATVVSSLEEAMQKADRTSGEIFFIGGAEIYRQALPSVDRIYLTVIHRHVDGDATFPEIPEGRFRVTSREDHREPEPFSFLVYERKE